MSSCLFCCCSRFISLIKQAVNLFTMGVYLERVHLQRVIFMVEAEGDGRGYGWERSLLTRSPTPTKKEEKEKWMTSGHLWCFPLKGKMVTCFRSTLKNLIKKCLMERQINNIWKDPQEKKIYTGLATMRISRCPIWLPFNISLLHTWGLPNLTHSAILFRQKDFNWNIAFS